MYANKLINTQTNLHLSTQLFCLRLYVICAYNLHPFSFISINALGQLKVAVFVHVASLIQFHFNKFIISIYDTGYCVDRVDNISITI